MAKGGARVIAAVVIGAGAVGLAVARAFALAGHPPLVIDAERAFGTQTSSRSSEVIHAGLYYPPGSLKARCCIEGRERLYTFCRDAGVPHRRLGKLVVAVEPDEEPALAAITAKATALGVPIERLSASDARRHEPEVRCAAALFSPTTGVFDSHAYMLALLGGLEAAGGQFVGGARVTSLTRAREGWTVWVDGAPAATAPFMVNAAGLGAHALAAVTEGLPPRAIPPLYYARGRYFTLSGRAPFRHLVYPLPVAGSLGVHVTLDLAGAARFGPDIAYVDAPDYTVDPAAAPAFAEAIARYWPAVRADRLLPGYAGVRPRLTPPGAPLGDFVVSGPDDHGLPGLVNLFGIESPGLTASLALAEIVVGRAQASARAAAA